MLPFHEAAGRADERRLEYVRSLDDPDLATI